MFIYKKKSEIEGHQKKKKIVCLITIILKQLSRKPVTTELNEYITYLANGAQARNRRGPVLNAAAAVSANPRYGRRVRRARACEHST